MQSRTHLAGPVALTAAAGSANADRIAAELGDQGLRIVRLEHGERISTDPVAIVVLVEDQAELDVIRPTLDQSSTPALVLAATPELARGLLPVLSMTCDVGLASEANEVTAWRITRLVDLSQLPASAAYRDALTGLLNRRAFEMMLRETAESAPSEEVTGLLMIDLDRFKVINDRFGHAAGDDVLRAVGGLLSRILAPGDSAARVGGDEFACLLTRHDTDSVRNECERLLKPIRDLDVTAVLARESCPSIGASAGLTFVRPSTSVVQLLAEADLAMYEAKNGGRGQIVVHRGSAEVGGAFGSDLRLRHFESATRLASERLVEMIALKSRRLVEAATQEANVCPLTGLHNRRHFDAALSGEIDRARRLGRSLSLAYVDLDHFHDVNMTHGWPTGDRVLQQFAAVARANVRARDSVARVGGEEFLILMPDTPLEGARDMAERIRRSFESAVVESVAGQRVMATLSAGVAQWRYDMESPIAFVNQASEALLRAKHAGRSRVEAAGES